MKKVILACMLAAGCGAVPKAGEPLVDSVTLYNDGVRWERLVNAASRVPAAQREDFLDEREELAENLKITDWELERVYEHGGKARVRVKYTWYLDDEGTVHETHAAQAWERHGKAWLLIDEQRTRGEPMPGLREPDEPEADDEVADAEPR
jgi:hypothetical protein